MTGARLLMPWIQQGTKQLSINDTATSMEVDEQVVEITAIASAFAITLPPVAQAVGRIYVLHATAYTSDAATITPNSDDEVEENIVDGVSLVPSLAFGVDEEWLVLYSSGLYWHVLAKNIA